MGRVRCVVVTPEKAVLDETAELVIVPMFDGEFGVLPGCAPVIGRLGAGELRLKSGVGVEALLRRSGLRPGAIERGHDSDRAGGRSREDNDGDGDSRGCRSGTLPTTNAVERTNKARAREHAAGLKRVAAKNGAA